MTLALADICSDSGTKEFSGSPWTAPLAVSVLVGGKTSGISGKYGRIFFLNGHNGLQWNYIPPAVAYVTLAPHISERLLAQECNNER